MRLDPPMRLARPTQSAQQVLPVVLGPLILDPEDQGQPDAGCAVCGVLARGALALER
jgi:hypothetical protein